MPKLELEILGTASMVPTKERNHTSAFLTYKDKGILFDCGEGTQRQLKIAGIKPSRISKILITHWHGDHVLGLPGLLQTMGNSDYVEKLEIYGPKGSKKYFEHMTKSFAFDTKVEMEIKEVDEGIIFENNDFYIQAERLSHGILTLGYSFIEKDTRKIDKRKIKNIPGKLIGTLQKGKSVMIKGKNIHPDDVGSIQRGKKISFITDTEPCNGANQLAEGSDIMVCESTYMDELEEKGSQYKHMTAKQAALIASNNDVKKLVLIHFSGRYKTTDEIEKEARDIFPNTDCAYDFYKNRI